jgi:hypothetical protein
MKRNPFTYPISAEQWWKNMLADMSGYTPKTTFFADLSIAECFGEKALRESYRDIMTEWINNIEYITEFVMCLNHKIWQLNDIDSSMAEIYNKLWKDADSQVITYYESKGDKTSLSYYFRTLD